MKWLLQCALGLIVGAAVGMIGILHRPWRNLLHPDGMTQSAHLLAFEVGCALFVAGLATSLGDRLWLGDSYGRITHEPLDRSSQHNAASIGMLGIGFTLILWVILKNWSVL